MYLALIVIHVLVAFIMVGVILLQSGKGAEIGAAFGGSSQTVFGSRGAGTFLSKMTAVAATVFMLTSLSLAILSKQEKYSSTIGLDKPTSPTEAPASPSPGSPAAAPSPTEKPSNPEHNTPTHNAPAPSKP